MGKSCLKIALVLCMLVMASAAVYAGVINRITINNTVNVLANGIGIYMDQSCTAPLSTIAWGDISRGTMENFTFYVRADSGDLNALWDIQILPMGFTVSATLNGDVWPMNTSHLIPKDQVYLTVFTLNVASDAEVQPYIFYTEFRAEA